METAFPETVSQKLSFNADVELVFDERLSSPGTSSSAEAGNKLQANSALLSIHSPLLHNVIHSTNTDHTHLRQIPMIGTTKEDFLTMAAFLIPTIPLPKVTLDNLEVLLVEGRKWDVQVVLAHVEEFIKANAIDFDTNPVSPNFVFKWFELADRAGVDDVRSRCIEEIAARGRYLCIPDRLAGLSKDTLIKLVEGLAGTERLSGRYVPSGVYSLGRGYGLAASDTASVSDVAPAEGMEGTTETHRGRGSLRPMIVRPIRQGRGRFG